MAQQLDRFAELVIREQFNLADACLLIAEDAYPALPRASYIDRLDEMAAAVRSRIPPDAYAEQKIITLNHYLFGELGFSGDVEHYYDPRNSYLNEVIERRRGIPITLSVLYIEVGRRLGLALQGVSFPGHFLVKLKVKRGQLVLDPFAGGEPLGEDDLRKRLATVLPRDGRDVHDIDPYIEAATSRQIVARLLRNLKGIYMEGAKLEQALAVMNRMLLVSPESAEELRDRGLVYARLDCFRAAVVDLQNYLRRRPDAPDAAEMHSRLVELKGQASRLN